MTPKATLRPVAALVVFAGLACGHATNGGSDGPEPRTAPAADSELESLYRARVDSARARFTEADVEFMTGMIGHHAQALVMAEMAPSHGASPAVRTLAARIINAQNDEIATMQRWLKDRGQAVPEYSIRGIELTVRPAHAMHMPGMLTPAQMEELNAARGRDFDRLFLTYMIQHHRGAVTMVQDLFATDAAGEEGAVFKLASDIQADQSTEIARMELMLSNLSREGGAP